MDNNEQKLDRLLDDALADYSNVAPRAGLESRILANLAKVEPEPSSWLRWWPAFSFAAVAALIALAILLVFPKATPSHTDIARQVLTAPHTAPQPKPPESVARLLPPSRSRPPRRHVAAVTHTQSNAKPAQQQALVKKDTFPAASPLTSQEKMLFAYLRRTPPNEVMAEARPDEIIDVFQHPNQTRVPVRPKDPNFAK